MVTFNKTLILGAELELIANFDLQPLLEYFQNHTEVIRNSTDGVVHTVWLELEPTEANLDEALRRYTSLIDAFPISIRSLWDACTDRCINTGIQGGLSPHAVPVHISAEVLAGLAKTGVRLEFSIYAVDLKNKL